MINHIPSYPHVTFQLHPTTVYYTLYKNSKGKEYKFHGGFKHYSTVPPEIIKIRSEPVDLRPGAEATLICDSSSSNPPAIVSWWKDGIPVEGVNPTNKPGLWGGVVSTLELKVNITQEMNGMGYTCQGTNEVLQRSVHESINLNVLCKYHDVCTVYLVTVAM